jgi:hypothetical protein
MALAVRGAQQALGALFLSHRAEHPQIVDGSVGRSIVDEDQFKQLVGPHPQAVHALSRVSQLVVRDDDDRREAVVHWRFGPCDDQELVREPLCGRFFRWTAKLCVSENKLARFSTRLPFTETVVGNKLQ